MLRAQAGECLCIVAPIKGFAPGFSVRQRTYRLGARA